MTEDLLIGASKLPFLTSVIKVVTPPISLSLNDRVMLVAFKVIPLNLLPATSRRSEATL
jgi:hypothetical protein